MEPYTRRSLKRRDPDFKLIALVFLVQLCLPGATRQARAQAEKAAYPAMAPVDAYLIADRDSEIALLERSWGAASDDPEFWNPKVRSPICFNPAAARTFAPIFLMKTKLALDEKSRTEIAAATAAALDKKELPALEPGAMC